MSIINISAFKKLLLVSALLLTVSIGQAQDNPDDPSPTDPAVPVDGGLSLLLGAGVAYGVRRYRNLRKNDEGVN